MRLLVVVGTRPEAIKLAPVIKYALNEGSYVRVFATEQQEMAHQHLIDAGVPNENIQYSSLSPTSFNTDEMLGDILYNIGIHIRNNDYDYVIVQGDTTSALAGALAGFYNKVPVVHIEAGLRSYKLSSPFPEEGHRCLISEIATFHMAPTQMAYDNLVEENVRGSIYLVGNTGIDNLVDTIEKHNIVKRDVNDYILVTLHRRENRELVEALYRQLDILDKLSYDVRIIVHPHPVIQEAAKCIQHAKTYQALDQKEFLDLMVNARLVITDSGGVIEEAVTLGKPLIILRNSCERTEAFDGNSPVSIVNPNVKRNNLLSVIKDNMNDDEYPYPVSNVFGDGTSSEQIYNILLDNYTLKVV